MWFIALWLSGCWGGADIAPLDLTGLPAPHALPAFTVELVEQAHLVRAPPPPKPHRPIFQEDFSTPLSEAWTLIEPSRSAPEATLGIVDGELCIENVGAVTGRMPTLQRSERVLPGSHLMVSATVRVEALRPSKSGSGGGGIRLEIIDRQGNVQRIIDDLPRQLGSSAAPMEITTRFEVDSKASHVRMTLEAAESSATGRACFDDVSLERVSVQERFLGFSSPRTARHPLVRDVSLERITRPSLLAPGDTTWALPVSPEPAQLHVSLGVLPEGKAGGKACFTIRESPSERSWLRRCLIVGQDSRWRDVNIDLPSAAGERTLLFDVDVDSGGVVGSWGDPRIIPTAPIERMNLVLVVIDTLRADHLNVEGYAARSTSPGLDAFAARALRFSAAQAPSGWTAASLGSVVTGLLPATHRAGRRRVRTWSPDQLDDKLERKRSDYLQLTTERDVLAERLRAEGYETVGFSTNNFFGPRIGFHRGFSSYQMVSGNNIIGARRVVTAASDWLAGRRGRAPFFLTVHLIDPHHPYRMRRPYLDGYTPPSDFSVENETMEGREAIVLRELSRASRAVPEQVMNLYDAEIRYLDALLAPLLASLEDDNTAIVLLSDHGEGFGEHGAFIHGNTLYQELLHVPLWLRIPGQAPGVIDAPVSLLDVFPTFLQLAGLPIPDDLDGQALPRDASAADSARMLISEGMYSGEMEIAARQGKWKYVRTQPSPIKQTRPAKLKAVHEALFDLSADPGEKNDLSGEHPDPLRQMRTATLDHQHRTLRGIHFRCDANIQGTLSVDAPIGQIEVLEGGAGTVTIGPDRSDVQLQLDAASHLVVRTTDDAERIRFVGVDGETVFDGLSPAQVAPATVGGCALWVIVGQDQAGQLSEEDVEELRALGYLE
ncbi:MAG: sulfatase-like hydrolase/transferase [Myxococcota bacterium]